MTRMWTRFSLRSAMLLMVLICLLSGLRAGAIQRHARAAAELKKLGAQFQLSEDDSAIAWLFGRTSSVQGVHFLGPRVGDENIEDITQAASNLQGLTRMTFAESRISREGEQQLRASLQDVQIEVFTPILAPPITPFRR